MPKVGAANLRKPGEVKLVSDLNKERSRVEFSSRNLKDSLPRLNKKGTFDDFSIRKGSIFGTNESKMSARDGFDNMSIHGKNNKSTYRDYKANRF